MLGVFLISDVFFLQQIKLGLAEDYSQYVHQGVGLLIFSILIASAFILFFFREKTNALLPKGDALKVLAILWIVLNLAIVLTTVGKNLYYVGSYGLSLKRIGVFIYLGLSVVGLVMVLFKIHWQKTNSYLIRSIYWSFFIVLSFCVFTDWSKITVRYNLHQHVVQKQVLDWRYLISLNPRNAVYIANHADEIRFDDEAEKKEFETQLQEQLQALQDYSPDVRELSLALKVAQNHTAP